MNKTVSIVQAGLMTALLFSALLLAGDDEFLLPAGTSLQVRLITTLSSKYTQSGDPWTGQVVEPVFAGGQQVLEAGSTVEGRVTYVKEPGRAKGVGEMRLVAETLTTPGALGAHYAIVAALKGEQGSEGVTLKKDEEGTLKGPGKSKKDAVKQAGKAAAAGGAAGAVFTGSGTDALYGAAIGATAALVYNVIKHHKDIVLSQGTELTFVLSSDVTAKKVVHTEAAPTN
jgi:hypothetical protein